VAATKIKVVAKSRMATSRAVASTSIAIRAAFRPSLSTGRHEKLSKLA
jgi:hypothetical protein